MLYEAADNDVLYEQSSAAIFADAEQAAKAAGVDIIRSFADRILSD